VSPVRPGPGRAAIIRLAGGMDCGLDVDPWKPAKRTNDQSARAFSEAGLMMFPSLRGCNGNPPTR
jgi:hypothetical protein